VGRAARRLLAIIQTVTLVKVSISLLGLNSAVTVISAFPQPGQ